MTEPLVTYGMLVVLVPPVLLAFAMLFARLRPWGPALATVLVASTWAIGPAIGFWIVSYFLEVALGGAANARALACFAAAVVIGVAGMRSPERLGRTVLRGTSGTIGPREERLTRVTLYVWAAYLAVLGLVFLLLTWYSL
jgi:hypothetical protein